MLWAFVNKEKVEASPKTKGLCPLCENQVFSRCGEINSWHWAHYKGEGCDNWYEPESFWHLHWKRTFGKDNAEVVIEKEYKKHIADIFTKEGVVIELQNSPIQSQVITERESFYGSKMLWLINGDTFKENFEIHEGAETFGIYRHFPEYRKSIKGIKPSHRFNWKWSRRSWKAAERPIFVDFGADCLFWVVDGMGTFGGTGKYVSKKQFINKYGGDYEYYLQKT
ncbi:MAG: hypothetical protein H6563_03715 [Lewinellaceae bacterium]|nr:hypothetical protein [Lewinellaceae bacterium]